MGYFLILHHHREVYATEEVMFPIKDKGSQLILIKDISQVFLGENCSRVDIIVFHLYQKLVSYFSETRISK